jgi:adenine deaminase
MNSIEKVKIARGEKTASLVLKNAKIVNVFSGLIEVGDIAIDDGCVVAIGTYSGLHEINLAGKFVAPGLIDGHVHIESSMLTPPEFAKIILPKGTTSIVADPHEIANVNGVEGIRYMMAASQTTPLDVFMMIPSCVPTTEFETAGAKITPADILKMRDVKNVIGLGEVMNYPGVLAGDPVLHEKIGLMIDRRVDGHAPGLTGRDLNAYAVTGIKTDHECTTKEELEERVARGMYVLMREGSHTQNVVELMKGVTEKNHKRLVFCTDDKHPEDILRDGHINHNVNLAIKAGLSPILAIRMASMNVAECYGLRWYGSIAPGYFADLIVFSDLSDIQPEMVFKKGVLVAENGKALFEAKPFLNSYVTNTVKIRQRKIRLDILLSTDKVHVIDLVPNNATTKKAIASVLLENGRYVSDPHNDILKLAVVERHKNTGNVGLGLVRGYGLHDGAVAMTIAHDSHNLIVLGDNDEDMMLAIKEIVRINGGIVIIRHHQVADFLPLEVGGIMTTAKAEVVIEKLTAMDAIARSMGVKETLDDPFLSLAFLSLPVIPEIKLTDKGLFDVTKFCFIPLEAKEADPA